MGYVMRQLPVELEEEEMAQLEASARAQRIDPARMTKAQLLKVLGAGKQMKCRGLRRNRVALKGARIVFTLRSRDARNSQIVQLNGPDAKPVAPEEHQQRARAKRLEALVRMQGIWKGDPDKPQDGVAYQREVRAEWCPFSQCLNFADEVSARAP